MLASLRYRKARPSGEASVIIIIILLLIIVGLIVWYAFLGNKPVSQTASPSPSASASASPDPYQDWKSGTLKYEKFNYKYPADWKVSDQSAVDADIGGFDKLTLTSPDGFAVSIRTNVWGIGGSCEDCKAFETTETAILGEKTGVSIFGTAKGASGIGLMRAALGGTTTYECIGLCTLPGKNTANKLNNSQPGLIMVTGGYPLSEAEAVKLGNSTKFYEYATFKADANVAIARKIFESFAY